ncbi:MAG: Tim44/TimA family putative adaptor protein [Alphaproteobacteria bacterium]|nr:Tim44/TimA family putative adaptor protein [Alphaproteobacteria bacterium]MCL2505654.1 Tim44/TimA family putative adaptor protein [Alphaproteobacteria bacterium]
MQVDVEIIIYAVIAAFIIGRLWYVLGTRNENEPKRPNPFAKPKQQDSEASSASCKDNSNNNVFLSDSSSVQKNRPPFISIKVQKIPAGKLEEANSLSYCSLPSRSLAGGLAQVQKALSSFNEKLFLQEAKDIFSSIVQAFNANNLSCVSSYLSSSLMGKFQDAINDESEEKPAAKLSDAEVVSAKVENKQVYITVRFISNIKEVKGHSEEIEDIWTFTKNPQNLSSGWMVVETK